eukprot:1192084-Prorocentrum_minimum.AAC.2
MPSTSSARICEAYAPQSAQPLVLAGTPGEGLPDLPPNQAPESTVGQPMAVCRQGMYVEYSTEYSKCRALNGILVSTVDACRLLN